MRHGILLNRWFLAPMARYFTGLGYEVYNSSYPSTRKTIQDHAKDLYEEIRRVAASAGNDVEIYFVTHSLGGLVLRYLLTHYEVPRTRRAVQIVPPNQGASVARQLKDDLFYRWVYGRHAGRQLTEDPEGIFAECGVPKNVEIGILAGVLSPLRVINVPVERPHDGVVSYREALLGDFPVLKLRVGHTPALFLPSVWRHVAFFLENGQFEV